MNLVLDVSLNVSLILAEVTLTTTLALAAVHFARNSRAAVRHVVLASAFAVLLILPLASLVAPPVRVAMPAAVRAAIEPLDADPILPATSPASIPAGAAVVSGGAQWSWPSWQSLLLAGWMAGVVAFLLPVFAGLRQVRILLRASTPSAEGGDVVRALAAEAGIRRPIDVLVHPAAPGPMTCGTIHPAIVLSVETQTWTAEDLHRALVHELEHVRRGDWLSLCLARVIAAFYWFHPIVWVAWRRLSLEAERACDDAVVRASEPTAYAHQLVLLAQRLSMANQPQLAMASRRDLAARVTAVLEDHRPRGRAGAACVAAAAVVCAILVITMSPLRIVSAASQGAPAQAAAGAPQKFDVASVKPCAAAASAGGARTGGSGNASSPGSINLNCLRPASLINLAYIENGSASGDDPMLAWTRFGGVDFSGNTPGPLKVRGGPAWAYSERFAVEARAPGAAERSVMMGPMLRSLLEERFRLKVHRESEDAPMWALTVASGGPKLARPTPGDCVELGTGTNPTWEQIKANGNARYCGRAFGVMGDTSHTVRAGAVPVSELVSMLTRDLGTKVYDRTGLDGVYNYTIEFALDENTALGASLATLPAASTAPTIFAALEQQLGLKLVKITGKRGFIVIDHIERPTPDLPALFSPPERASGSGR